MSKTPTLPILVVATPPQEVSSPVPLSPVVVSRRGQHVQAEEPQYNFYLPSNLKCSGCDDSGVKSWTFSRDSHVQSGCKYGENPDPVLKVVPRTGSTAPIQHENAQTLFAMIPTGPPLTPVEIRSFLTTKFGTLTKTAERRLLKRKRSGKLRRRGTRPKISSCMNTFSAPCHNAPTCMPAYATYLCSIIYAIAILIGRHQWYDPEGYAPSHAPYAASETSRGRAGVG